MLDNRDKTKRNLIVLVHGLGGNNISSWGRTKNFLLAHKRIGPLFDIKYYSYDTSKNPFSKTKSISEIGDELAADLQSFCSTYERIILVGHSMGGLIIRHCVKQLFNYHNLHTIRGIVLIATPNDGSTLNGILEQLKFWSYKNQNLISLALSSNVIDNLNDGWLDFVEQYALRVYSIIAEKSDEAVSDESGLFLSTTNNTIRISNKTHSNIIRPYNYDDDFIKNLQKIILKILGIIQSDIIFLRPDSNEKVKELFKIACEHSNTVYSTQFVPFQVNPFTKPKEDFLDTIIKPYLEQNPDIDITFHRYIYIANLKYLNSYVKKYFHNKPKNLTLHLYLINPDSINPHIYNFQIFNKLNFFLVENVASYIGLDRIANDSPDDFRTLGLYLKDNESLERIKKLWDNLIGSNPIIYCLNSVNNYLDISLSSLISNIVTELSIQNYLSEKILFVGLFGSYASDIYKYNKLKLNDFFKRSNNISNDDIDLFFVISSNSDISSIKKYISEVVSSYNLNIEINWGDEDQNLYPFRKSSCISIDIEIYYEGDKSFIDEGNSYRKFNSSISRKLLGYSIFYNMMPLYNPSGKSIHDFISFPKEIINFDDRKSLFLYGDKGVKYFKDRIINVIDDKTDASRLFSQTVKNHCWALSGLRPKNYLHAIEFFKNNHPEIYSLIQRTEKNAKLELSNFLNYILDHYSAHK